MREILRDREYVAYFLARQSARIAYSIEAVATSWQVYGLRHSALDLGLVGLVLFLPQLLLALPAGMLADRVDRRIVVISCALGDMLSLLLFVALVLSGSRSLFLNLGVVAIIGISHSLGDPAERALLAGIVESHRYVRAQALSTSVGELINIAGPALGGVLIAFGVQFAFAAAALCYTLASVSYFFLTPRPTSEEPIEPGAAADGIRFIFSHQVILGAISLDLFAVLFGGAMALLPIYATKILHVGPIGFGMLRSAPAIGGMIVAAYIARHPVAQRAGTLLLWCVAGFGLATIVFGISRNIALSLFSLAVAGGCDVVSVVIRSTLVQLDTPDVMRGRVSAVENIFIGASNQLGAFESGTVAAFLGPVLSAIVGGLGTLAVVALWAVFFPALRSYDEIRSPREPALAVKE